MTACGEYPGNVMRSPVSFLLMTLGVACSRPAATSRAPTPPIFRSVVAADTVSGIVTLPLYRGMSGNEQVWYIVTESSDHIDAIGRGVTFAPRMRNMAGTVAMQRGEITGGLLRYSSSVDFSPSRIVRPAPDSGFPALEAHAGSVGRPGYSPFVLLEGGIVINAPIIANATGALDRVISIDSAHSRVQLRMSRGYYDDLHAWYISTEASNDQVAAYERATYAPSLAAAPMAGMSNAASARSGILVITNGVRGRGSPERQGMQSALLEDLSPLNVLQHAPNAIQTDTTYSPLWDLHLVRWTSSAIAANQREKVFSWSEGDALAKRGRLASSGMGGPEDQNGLRAAGVAINCPIMITFSREARP